MATTNPKATLPLSGNLPPELTDVLSDMLPISLSPSKDEQRVIAKDCLAFPEYKP